MVPWDGYISDEVMGALAPIVVYWIYAGFYHVLPVSDRYRLHARKEEIKNIVSLSEVIKGVLWQQILQAVVAISMFQVPNFLHEFHIYIHNSMGTMFFFCKARSCVQASFFRRI